MTYREEIKVLDCTIRDGGLINNYQFSDELVRATYAAACDAHVDVFEIGKKLEVSEQYPTDKWGAWTFCEEDVVTYQGLNERTNRLAHYLKVLQREQIGAWKERTDLELELNKWIRQFVADQENPSAEVRSRRPLRAAQVNVSDVEGEPGWYRVSLSVRPHFKYMGADFTMSLVGKLDKE